MQPKRVRKLTTLARSTGVLLAAFCLALGYGDWSHGPISYAFVVLGAGLGSRAAVLGVSVGAEELLIRDWFRTRAFPRAAVHAVSTSGYDGMPQKGTRPSFLSVLTIRTNEREFAVYATVATWRSARRKRDALRQALGYSHSAGRRCA